MLNNMGLVLRNYTWHIHHVSLFPKEKDQLTAVEVEQTPSIANVRFHVEWVYNCNWVHVFDRNTPSFKECCKETFSRRELVRSAH